VSLSIQEEVLRGGVEELSDVVRVVAACLWDLEGPQQPVLLQVLRVSVVVELLQHFAHLRDGRGGRPLL
jgi:hypothetical protein